MYVAARSLVQYGVLASLTKEQMVATGSVKNISRWSKEEDEIKILLQVEVMLLKY